MVFIHGGGFYEGCAKNQTGEYLMERDVVLVTIQYRLGPLGFLQTDTGSIPGNMGLMDMKLALEWVQEHIGRFGGDPANVTLFGQSAGAAAISALLYSPQVPDGLFHKVILQSAGSSAPWVWDREPLQSVRDLAFEAGEEFDAPEEEIDTFYQNVDVWKLLQVFNEYKVKTTLESGLDRVGGNRLVTGDWERYLPQTPLECMKQGKVRLNIPMMAGVTKHEGTFLLTTVYDHFKRTGKLDDPTFMKYGLMDAVSKFLGAGDDPTGAFVGYQMRSLFTSKELESGSFGEMADGLIDVSKTKVSSLYLVMYLIMNSLLFLCLAGGHHTDQSAAASRSAGECTRQSKRDVPVHVRLRRRAFAVRLWERYVPLSVRRWRAPFRRQAVPFPVPTGQAGRAERTRYGDGEADGRPVDVVCSGRGTKVGPLDRTVDPNDR